MLLKKLGIFFLFLIGPFLMMLPFFLNTENERLVRIIGGIIFVGTSLYAYHLSDFPKKSETHDG